MTLATRPEHLILAVLQGIAAQVAELATPDRGRPRCAAAPAAGGRWPDPLPHPDAGTADLLQMPIDVYPSAHATALGAAALGRSASTPGLGIDGAMPAWTPSDTYEPAWSSDRSAEFRARWRSAVTAAVPTAATP